MQSSASVFSGVAIAVALHGTAHAAEADVRLEFHYFPVPDAQIAIWLARPDGTFVQDVFVTQSTGTLGIGNRPGLWDYVSSFRFPYGPRTGVLPIWAHARAKTYPRLVYFDDDDVYPDSLGWHESYSSFEPYFCTPLTQEAHNAIVMDAMTCPSPGGFRTDKGQFADAGAQSVYPPRNDLMEFDEVRDSPDAMMLSILNELDGVTGATPTGVDSELVTAIVSREIAEAGPLVAKIEINLERDENPDWEFDRIEDHWVDPNLDSIGIEYLGQPSVLYTVELDPMSVGFVGTDMYSGYGELDGTSGAIHPPDSSISTDGGSGADRLRVYDKNGETFRFGIYSHGPDSGSSDPTGGGESGGSDDGSSDPTGGNDDGWGCVIQQLPALTNVEAEGTEFDRARVHFTVPPLDGTVELESVRLFHRLGAMPIDDASAGSAIQSIPSPDDCGEELAPGVTTWCEIDGLFGNFEYQVAVRLEDVCNNSGPIVGTSVRTPAQEFATVDGTCFVATAAFGAPWMERVGALRGFRDTWMRPFSVGAAFVLFYEIHGPTMARAIADRPLLRTAVRSVLAPIADAALVVGGR